MAVVITTAVDMAVATTNVADTATAVATEAVVERIRWTKTPQQKQKSVSARIVIYTEKFN